ncbi:L-xylulose reductase-like [Centruroides vittatus]|uniref:L-xylulose reductase-like n=1 Tax=Centruroides vittatus TaxID=120091 RepID=UPI00351045C0
MSYEFKGKRALVTGGSRGIGKEIVKQLTKCGAQVYALSKVKRNLDALKVEIPSVEIICVDLSDWKKTEEVVSKIGTIDFLVNNAGIVDTFPFGEITEESFDNLYSVNVKPIINVSQIVVKKLKQEKKPGAIVNISSVSSLVHLGTIIYSSGKAAIDKITKLMAVELGPHKIRVNSVNPGVVYTEMSKSYLDDPKISSMLKSFIPLQEFCNTEDIAYVVLFLLSDKARMINGITLPIDGGQSAR